MSTVVSVTTSSALLCSGRSSRPQAAVLPCSVNERLLCVCLLGDVRAGSCSQMPEAAEDAGWTCQSQLSVTAVSQPEEEGLGVFTHSRAEAAYMELSVSFIQYLYQGV